MAGALPDNNNAESAPARIDSSHAWENSIQNNAPSADTSTPESLLSHPNENRGLMSIDGLRNNGTLQSFVQSSLSHQLPVTSQPRSARESASPSHFPAVPQSLFMQALTKLNQRSPVILNLDFMENSNGLVLNHSLRSNKCTSNKETASESINSPELSAPDSLTSAPPSYSFVLRQINARRRPRLMGTFIPSPSFVQHTPPPTYAQAFDIYVDNSIASPPPRTYTFGFHPMLVICPECGFAGTTSISTKVTICTHMCAFTLCVSCCCLCVPLPYILSSCKDVYHYCRNCRYLLGVYCPTNPQNL